MAVKPLSSISRMVSRLALRLVEVPSNRKECSDIYERVCVSLLNPKEQGKCLYAGLVPMAPLDICFFLLKPA